ncbi:MAG: LexA family transcriptional regulator [Prevotellaceae bacterium]|nr:LexA family transcriptional regulator [Prevotellaceae bacterium]
MNKIDIREIREKLGVSQEKLAEMIGVHPRTVQNWESGSKIPYSKYTILHNLSIKSQQYAGGSEVPVQIEKEYNLVPLIPISAQGGTLNDFVVSVKESDCEKIVSPIRGADFAISVAGESMSPEYPSGSLVLIKKINERAFIDWGKVYVLDTENGTIIKKLMPSKDNDKVLCVSINPEYPPFEVSFEHIYGLFRVLMCLSLK